MKPSVACCTEKIRFERCSEITHLICFSLKCLDVDIIQAFVVDDDGKNHTLVGQHQVAIEALNKEATTQVIVRVSTFSDSLQLISV